MREQAMDEQLMIEYLTGSLPESETDRLDEMSVSNEVFAEQLRVVENDLVDAYVRGELSGETLTRFKSHYLATSRGRQKVSFAETFRDRLIAHPEQTTFKPVLRTSAMFRYGLAAVLAIMMFAAGYLMFDNVRLRNQRSELEQREQELQRALDLQRSSDTEKEKELARVREKLAELEKRLPAGEQREVKLIALHLFPQTRGIARIPVLTVPADTGSVDVTLELETNDFSAYTVSLKNPASDQIVWSDQPKAGKNIRFRLPANLLKTQNYVLELSGISTSGPPEIVSSYPFRVIEE